MSWFSQPIDYDPYCIVSFPGLGNLVMKSIVTYSHFHSGSSGCCSKPDGFWCSALT
ncbi:hypothetical protein HanRHA438_Chr08g0335221 [Helianthus annuus]|nr:hypothetical protein HanRHA438_Chr08g0335221 [Helianthus annuus]